MNLLRKGLKVDKKTYYQKVLRLTDIEASLTPEEYQQFIQWLEKNQLCMEMVESEVSIRLNKYNKWFSSIAVEVKKADKLDKAQIEVLGVKGGAKTKLAEFSVVCFDQIVMANAIIDMAEKYDCLIDVGEGIHSDSLSFLALEGNLENYNFDYYLKGPKKTPEIEPEDESRDDEDDFDPSYLES